MRELCVARSFERDVIDCFETGLRVWGERVTVGYQALIELALRDIAEAPFRPRSIARTDLGDGIRVYPLEACIRRVRNAPKVQSPAHWIVYRARAEETHVDVVRLLRGGGLVPKHLP